MIETLSLKTFSQDEPPKPPTTLKEPRIKPKGVEIEETVPATDTVLELYRRYKTHRHNLDEIKRMVDEIRNQYEAERERIERETGKVRQTEELQKVVEDLSTMVEATESKLVDLGTEVAYLRDEVTTQAFKPTDKWKLEKVLEKFDQNGEITAYLEKAVQGAQSLSKQVRERELSIFPHPERRPKPFMSSLKRAVHWDGVLDTLKNVYQNLKDYFTGIEEAVETLQGNAELPVAASLSLRQKFSSFESAKNAMAETVMNVYEDFASDSSESKYRSQDEQDALKWLNQIAVAKNTIDLARVAVEAQWDLPAFVKFLQKHGIYSKEERYTFLGGYEGWNWAT